MKKAKNEKLAEELQENFQNLSHARIQWGGTDVCMDIRCICGEISHVDGDFTFNVQCPYCDKMYNCNPHIELIEIEEEPEFRLHLAIK